MKRINKARHTRNVHYSLLRQRAETDRNFNSACCGALYRFPFAKSLKVHLHFRQDQLQYNKEDFAWWTNFMNECGFPCKLIEDYRSEAADISYVTIELRAKEYVNKVHLFAGVTAIRYIGYGHSTYFLNIPETVSQIKEMFPEEDSLKCLLLAHYPIEGYLDESHALPYNTAFKLISKDQMLEKVKVAGSVNESISVRHNDHTFFDLQKVALLKTKEAYSHLFQILK